MDTETMLLVDNDQAEPGKLTVFLKQCMSADKQLCFPAFQVSQDFALLPSW